MYIEGKISHNNPSYSTARETAGPRTMIAVGQQKQMAMQQISDGTYRVYFGLGVPETGSAVDKTEAVRQRLLSLDDFYASWAPQLKAIIANSEGPFRAWSLYRMELGDIGWKREVAPGVTLLGDAAHVSTSFVGQGVNSLRECFKSHQCSDNQGGKALASYEEDLFKRGRDLVRRSTESEEMLFAENADAHYIILHIWPSNGIIRILLSFQLMCGQHDKKSLRTLSSDISKSVYELRSSILLLNPSSQNVESHFCVGRYGCFGYEIWCLTCFYCVSVAACCKRAWQAHQDSVFADCSIVPFCQTAGNELVWPRMQYDLLSMLLHLMRH
ncbi:FAD-dependent oxidoreductase [Aspergillus fischeri NRRL 181]|uniref:FAD-binding domain-containing protein n=1 Tax=Neosartorya fischeri (strain ATCC 1020 / DSM 3700 / CBS 544.65 / FGSC A1164 / JCM 1740 / NRRL 181 / WB 181) TaxID=331117 RepID=A1DBY8_NEOFI|nr:uncharacterized protein NFIA_100150 [Aspergillus fischeri NRRL 181]EAW20378.1 hypothetical protein NFIA_100150 [Aspergillus fischeri NRRL 181]